MPDLPPPLRMDAEGTFAHHTLVTRLPDTISRILRENALDPVAVARLEHLRQEIPHGTVRPLADRAAPDADAWAAAIEPYLGRPWLDLPWFFAETYFFRRVIEATGFFGEDEGQDQDPYAHQKSEALRTTEADTRALADRLEELRAEGWHPDAFAELLKRDLWGNQADLNLFPVGDDHDHRHDDVDSAEAHLLADDSAEAAAHLDGRRPARIDVIVDNAGFEFVCDLALVDYALGTGAAAEAHLHVKLHPTYVSDVTHADVELVLDALAGDPALAVQALAGRLRDALADGRLLVHADAYWTSPHAGWEMPERLRARLAPSALVVCKGDMNYRRLLGDRDWPYTTAFASIVDYFPAPLVALRTLKAEIAAGLRPGTSERLDQEDPDWLVNGRWGVIQFAGG